MRRRIHNRVGSVNDARNTMETHRELTMTNITKSKRIFSSVAVIVILVPVSIITAARGAASKKSSYEQKIEKIMVDYVRAIQTAENAHDNKMATLIKSARTIRDRAITKVGQAVQTKLERAARDSKRLRRPDEAKLAEEEIIEFAKLVKQARTADPYKPEVKKPIEKPVVESGPLRSHVTLRGNAYIAIMRELAAYEAKRLCKKLGGRLVRIESAEELLFLQKNLPVGHVLWVGAEDNSRQGKWKWSTGTAVNRACWAPKQPHKVPDPPGHKPWNGIRAALRRDGMYSRRTTDKCKGFICEWGR
jgi:hypothetical protein